MASRDASIPGTIDTVVLHHTAAPAALENLPRIAVMKIPQRLEFLPPLMALEMCRFLTRRVACWVSNSERTTQASPLRLCLIEAAVWRITLNSLASIRVRESRWSARLQGFSQRCRDFIEPA